MKLYLNELAPWEEKKEYYHQIQLGKDINIQAELLRTGIEEQTRAQLASASAIVASQDRIAEGIGDLTNVNLEGFNQVNTRLDDISSGIAGLQAAFEWGISEVVWQLEQNRKELKQILEVLQSPLDTQARERRNRAEKAYTNGWIDDAEEEYLESEKLNRYDFAIHISLGIIYLFHKIDKKKSFDYFQNAYKYALPESKYYASYALLHLALINRSFNKLEESAKFTEKAIELTPDFIEAYYQNAQYNAQISNSSLSIKRLEKAIRADLKYCLKVDNDSMFDPIRQDVNDLINKLTSEITNNCSEKIKKVKNSQSTINSILKKIDHKEIKDFRKELNKIETLMSRHSFFDSIKALDAISALSDLISKDLIGHHILIKRTIDSLEGECLEFRENLNDQHKKAMEKIKEKRDSFDPIFTGIGLFTIILTSAGIAVVIGYFISVLLGLAIGFVAFCGFVRFFADGREAIIANWLPYPPEPELPEDLHDKELLIKQLKVSSTNLKAISIL